MHGDNQSVSPRFLVVRPLTTRLLRYHCEACDIKVDATRYTILDCLPPVLHFSLLRFVFSAVDFERSKSNHAISYPLKINMGQFLPIDDQGQSSEIWYDLKGVLMHKGKSAHHGHYVAQVHDNTFVVVFCLFGVY